MLKPLARIENAGIYWHERIGRHLSTNGWEYSLSQTYPCRNKKGESRPMRLGTCLAAAIMIDADCGVLIDKLNIPEISGLRAPDCDFHYGENVGGITNVAKTQINWALDERRTYPLLLVRPSPKSPYECLMLSQTPQQITVCIPSGSYSFEADPVRQARDYILQHDLQLKWANVAKLRQTVRRNEHHDEDNRQMNKVMGDYAKACELIPLDVYLPEPGTGEYIALAEALAAKQEVDISTHIRQHLAANQRI